MKGMFNVIESKAESILNHDYIHWDLVCELKHTIEQYHSDLVEAENMEEVKELLEYMKKDLWGV